MRQGARKRSSRPLSMEKPGFLDRRNPDCSMINGVARDGPG
jgi:hypothetical protein